MAGNTKGAEEHQRISGPQPGNRKIISLSAPKTERLLVREGLLLRARPFEQ